MTSAERPDDFGRWICEGYEVEAYDEPLRSILIEILQYMDGRGANLSGAERSEP